MSCEVKTFFFVRNKSIIKDIFNFILSESSFNNIAFSSEKESGEKYAQIKHHFTSETARTVINKYVSGFWCDVKQEIDFSHLLWILDLNEGLKLKSLND